MNNVPAGVPVEAMLTAFESSYDGLHILDRTGKTLYINSACTRIEGISQEEAIKKDIFQLVRDGIYSESVTLRVLETKEVTTIIQVAKNGNRILATGTPIFDENDEISMIVVNSRDITELNELRQEVQVKENELNNLKIQHGRYEGVIAKSSSMQRVLRTALSVAKFNSTVLITGESGVGKGLLANFIHQSSERMNKPLIKIDCSSIPETLIESELFGYEKGAFTGADKKGKIGLLEMANGGTVFLDEIGEMPLSMQAKLMRAIQDRVIVPVGGTEEHPLDVRFIAATNVDLVKMVKEKLFREDLYYRINVVPLHIPALRERPEDLILLIKHITDKINHEHGFKKMLSSEVHNLLINYDWPGNVRQLENYIERVLVSNEHDLIEKEDIDIEVLKRSGESIIGFCDDLEHDGYKGTLDRFDEYILRKIIEQEGSIPKAAKKSGVAATTIRRKLERYKNL